MPPENSLQHAPDSMSVAATGIEGLDNVLGGGFVSNRLYLVEGVPGSGKTTLAMQFLMEGARNGEAVLYVTLSETAEELRAIGESHGWALGSIAIHELVTSADSLEPSEQYTMFHPSEVELTETTKAILKEVERVKPTRIVFDSLSEMRLLAGNTLRYRRQILAFKQYFAGRHCTVLMLDDRTALEHDMQVQSIAHGVIMLEQMYPEYGSERRRLRVVKYRGHAFRGGNHDYIIRKGGLEVFPRLVAAEHRSDSNRELIASGIAELDALLGGGVERSTSTLLVGAAGTGKSSIASLFAAEAAAQNRNAAMFLFDENMNTLLNRADGLGIRLRQGFEAKRISIQQIDPAEMSPGQLASAIRHVVEQQDVQLIVIDSLNGYLNAMPEERFLIIQLHEIFAYLCQKGVATILISAHHGLVGGQMNSPLDASYLADSVVLLRYFEARGEIRQAISVVKKRGGEHERTIREFRMEKGRISVGEPLREFRGVLTGVPVYEGTGGQVLRTDGT